MTSRLLRSFAATALLVGAAACNGDDTAGPDTTGAEPTTTPATSPDTTSPDTTSPDTTSPDTAPETTAPATTAPETTTADTTTTTEAVRLVDVRDYFLRGERLDVVHRDVPGPAVLRGALEALVAGPTEPDLDTAIPDGTELLDVNLADGIATVDLTREFESGGGSMSMFARVGQVVFTATQFDNVDAVVFWLDGAPIDFLGGEGLVMTEPWTRMMVPRDLTGAVIVDSPRPGDTVTSPFTVTGEGDVYEADFPIEIRRDGETLAVFAPITAGAWGDWRDFSTVITLDIDAGPFELVAYDEGGCGDAPECPPIVETVVPLVLAG